MPLTYYNNKQLNRGTSFASNLVNLTMNNSIKISVLGAVMLLSASVHAQSDSLGMPGDDLDLRAVLSIFKQSSSVEDFEKRLNSADTKVNNIDLNNDNQVDYLRVVDYGKDDFHSIVIQDPVSKGESQDVAVIEIVKKGDNTAHVQIVGDETLYGKDYIIEPEDQAPLNSASDKNKNKTDDDVYADPNSPSTTSHVMINVWGWPSVNYIYGPSYVYYTSPWYYGYYPGWYSPWRPYGWYAYRSGWMGYNYGFYGYRRYHYAFPHVHNYYYGRRSYSGYVQKNAPRYNGRRDSYNNAGYRDGQPRNNGARNTSPGARSGGNANSGNRVRSSSQGNRTQNTDRRTNTGTSRSTNQGSGSPTPRSTNQGQAQSSGGDRANSAPRSNNAGAGRVNSGGAGGSRMNGGGGGGRSGGAGGGGGSRSGGGGGGSHSGGGGRR